MNNKIEVTGTVCYVGDIETVGKNNFQKRTFTIKDEGDGKYPTFLAFTLKKDKCELVKKQDNGRVVSVAAYVESRDWTDPKTNKVKFFTDVTAVKVDFCSKDINDPAPQDVPDAPEAEASTDDLPF